MILIENIQKGKIGKKKKKKKKKKERKGMLPKSCRSCNSDGGSASVGTLINVYEACSANDMSFFCIKIETVKHSRKDLF